MTEASLISLFVRPLNRLRIPCMVTGGVALNAWAIEHTVIRRVDDDDVVMVPIEAVILSKLQVERAWARAQEYQEPE